MIWHWRHLARKQRVKALLNQFIELYDNEEEYRRRLANYQRVLKTEEWAFLRDSLMTIKGVMMGDMFSRRFTDLDQQEKDVAQKTYYQMDQILTFLLNPSGWIKKRSKWQQLNPMGKPKGKEK